MTAAAAVPAALTLTQPIKDALKFPVIGYKKTVTKTGKRGTTTKEYSFQLRAWEAGAGALGVAAITLACIGAGVLKWKQHTYTYTDANGVKRTGVINFPGAGDSGGSGFAAPLPVTIPSMPGIQNTGDWWKFLFPWGPFIP